MEIFILLCRRVHPKISSCLTTHGPFSKDMSSSATASYSNEVNEEMKQHNSQLHVWSHRSQKMSAHIVRLVIMYIAIPTTNYFFSVSKILFQSIKVLLVKSISMLHFSNLKLWHYYNAVVKWCHYCVSSITSNCRELIIVLSHTI